MRALQDWSWLSTWLDWETTKKSVKHISEHIIVVVSVTVGENVKWTEWEDLSWRWASPWDKLGPWRSKCKRKGYSYAPTLNLLVGAAAVISLPEEPWTQGDLEGSIKPSSSPAGLGWHRMSIADKGRWKSPSRILLWPGPKMGSGLLPHQDDILSSRLERGCHSKTSLALYIGVLKAMADDHLPPAPKPSVSINWLHYQEPDTTCYFVEGPNVGFLLVYGEGIWKEREFYIWIVIYFTIGDRRIGETICTQPKSS